MLATGTFERALDSKHRVLLPKQVRSSILEADDWFATPGSDGCLELHSTSSIRKLGEERACLASGAARRQFERLFFSQAVRLEVDGQGRVRLPRQLVDYADLESQIVIVGAGSHWEVWTGTLWREYVESHALSFDPADSMSGSPQSDLLSTVAQSHPK